MIGNKVKYTCKNCGWSTSIQKEWTDLKPKRCMNRKCNTSFQKFKEALIVEHPIKIEEIEKKSTRSRKNKNENTTSE